MGKWPQRRSRRLRRFRRSEPPIIADFFLPSTPHFEVVDAASFEPEGFLRSEPAILAGFHPRQPLVKSKLPPLHLNPP